MTTTSGLEVDARSQARHTGPSDNSKYSVNPSKATDAEKTGINYAFATQRTEKSLLTFCFAPATFWLSIALAVAVILAAVAAGVAGSIATRRGNEIQGCA